MRYGSFKYGSGRYGTSPINTQLWALLIDWDGDGQYDNYNEAGRMTDLRLTRGRRNMLRSDGSGFEPVDIGRLTIELDNSDGRYHPFNKSSPLYPYVRPGVKIAVITRLTTGQICPVFAGRIDDIVPISGRWDRVKLTALDGLAWLRDQEVELDIQSSQRVGDLIETILDSAQWPWATNLESSTDVVPWFWSPDGRSCLDLITELANVHWSAFFAAADGTATYYSRNHWLASSKMRIEQGHLSDDVMLRAPWGVIRNKLTMVCHPRTQQNTAVVWSLYDKPSIAAGETFETWGTFTDSGQEVPLGSYTMPVAGIDYVVNTNQDGNGTDLTASCSVNVSVNAGSVLYRLTNNSGQAGYITLMQLRGQALTEKIAKVQATASASQALFGPKTMTIDSPFLQDPNLAQTIADALIAQIADPQAYPTVTIENRPEIQYTLDLFDYVDLVIDSIGVGGVYQVAYVEHRWLAENGQAAITVLGFEPVNRVLETVWTFPAQIGVDTIFAF